MAGTILKKKYSVELASGFLERSARPKATIPIPFPAIPCRLPHPRRCGRDIVDEIADACYGDPKCEHRLAMAVVLLSLAIAEPSQRVGDDRIAQECAGNPDQGDVHAGPAAKMGPSSTF